VEDLVRPSSPHRLKRWIALNLKQLRKDAGLGRPEVAKRLGVSRTSVGHLESARNLPSQATLEILLGYYGVPERLDDFAALVEAARRGKNWWNHLAGASPAWFDEFLGLEAGAAELRIFGTYLMPGILQTYNYATAVVRADPELTDEQVRQRVELRIGRQAILDRAEGDEPVQLWVVLDESVLYRRRGTAADMIEQIDHLLKMSERPRIEVQVLPLDAGAHIAQQGSFQLLQFPPEFVGDPGVAYLELLTEGRYYEDPEEVAAYARAFTRLQVAAAAPQDSQAILLRARKEMSE
jgi:transcriptional regulator with XRE-family HTH domain